ncbi:uncharacterized protein LOC9663184 [Selaginella moellendorffii]|uniref:uncharacterized protein LOC9663184 n=1 Tax=Selaginella moellendorffii TaxID=88036 RepID=UPI000D1C976A|nr:uncharacterized protein LOC9663184 [Selaginella moellendorffii]|eukprot:XP_024517281.1 uncharacterized protein LOC9663184 [Selaginella moellendorffii]
MARALACCYVTREALAASTQSHQQTTQHRVPKLLDSAPDVQALPLDDQLAFKSSPRKANVYNWLYSSRRLRRIRITYFDAGRACQALNALLYPDNRFALVWREQDPVRGRFYTTLSRSRLLGEVHSSARVASPAFCSTVLSGGMYRVYTQYVATYLKSLHSLEPNEDPRFCVKCHEKQAAYDRYLADRDPAFKVFSSYFGSEESAFHATKPNSANETISLYFQN